MIVNFLVFIGFVCSIILILYCLGLIWLTIVDKFEYINLKEVWLICIHGGLLLVALSYIFLIIRMGCYFGDNIINNFK